MNQFINPFNLDKSVWDQANPFPHIIIDNFFKPEIALQLADEFPDYHAEAWDQYHNQIEVKKTCNHWKYFPALTYQVFSYLNSTAFIQLLTKQLFDEQICLYADQGLNGGGWHIHPQGGKLNTHLDYSLHPKLGLQRKVNLLVYLNPNWQSEWGGALGLWENKNASAPGNLVKQIEPVFNRAVLFDTTCNSWHGLPEPIGCPDNEYRQSIALYYLTDPPKQVDPRGKALFAPTAAQADDPEIIELIKRRSSVGTAHTAYGDTKKDK